MRPDNLMYDGCEALPKRTTVDDYIFLNYSSPGKRFMEERNSFSSAEEGGGTSKDRTGDGTASDYGSESSGFKAGGSMDSSLATNRQYYEQQLNYYQNNPMTGRDTICVFCLTR